MVIHRCTHTGTDPWEKRKLFKKIHPDTIFRCKLKGSYGGGIYFACSIQSQISLNRLYPACRFLMFIFRTYDYAFIYTRFLLRSTSSFY